ncbi:type I-E CRISPR-associated protein Cas6/Cse3/CasE [Thalassomonas haliotis]|uniref:Type I-E CRISPR-associated protein Cas6/Cse3/CasE n=1 Tax=Thalassomonas haliotis TaxID=485448 RepID=A0ABY7VFI6_9GAMM|nr:type I-E CRISPR-associated protein Cas6/Cse3/CasE [Thalassomonas haliotis]WDE12328.1 type I-E CRISPR-associated protein Cas6/Cse3/CasE [Thalassomonas haliotis]
MYLSRIRLKPEMTAVQLAQLLKDRKGYGLHRLFWGIWGADTPKRRDFLFREEVANEQGLATSKRVADPVYYLLSPQEPDQQHPLFDIQSKPYQPALLPGDKLSFKLRVNPVVTRNKKRHDIAMNAQYDWLVKQLKNLEIERPKDKKACKHLLLDFADDQMVKTWKGIIEEGCFADQGNSKLARSEVLEWALKTVVDQAYQTWWQAKGNKHGFECITNQYHQVIKATAYQKHHMPEKDKQASFNSVDITGELTVIDVEKFKQALVNGIGPAKAFGCGLMMVKRVN